MTPKQLHSMAMVFSTKALTRLQKGEELIARRAYQKAAFYESQCANFYFDKPWLEPTRSILIRSAAWLNLKAGNEEEAKKYFELLDKEID